MEKRARGHYKKVPVNIEDVVIDGKQSKDKRIASFVKQVKDPFRLKIGGVLVEMEYSDNGCSMQELVETVIGID